MKHVIGIAGKKRSGKDTVANMLADLGWYRYGFADPIKAITEIGLGLKTEWLNRDEVKEEPQVGLNGHSPRRVWQEIGTKWGRETIHPDIWLMVAGWHMERNGPNMVVADVRFENEADWIRKQGGRIIHVRRPGLANTDPHKSEAGIERCYGDLVIDNDSTLIHLKSRVVEAVRIIGG